MVETDLGFDKTIKDIVEYTELKESYLRDVFVSLKDVLKPYYMRGNNNEYLFSSNALPIFYQVKVLRGNGLRLGKIKTTIEKEFKVLDNSVSVKTENYQKKSTQNENPNPIVETLLNHLQEKDKSLSSVNLELLQTKDELSSIKLEHEKLKTTVLFLTDGRTPEQLRSEQLAKDRENLAKEFKLTQAESKITEKNTIIEELKNKEEELKKIDLEKTMKLSEKERELNDTYLILTQKDKDFLAFKEEQEKKDKLYIEQEEKKKALLKELELLEGKWLVGSKRKLILKQLSEL